MANENGLAHRELAHELDHVVGIALQRRVLARVVGG
jgi:hypothetical protein